MKDNEFPFTSIVIPCRNEEKHISMCLDSVLSNSYPTDKIEILVVDGMSTDGTRDILKKYEAENDRIHIIDNPRKITPVAFNTGIKAAKGEYILIMGAHAEYENDYILKCITYAKEYNADNVGGVIFPKFSEKSSCYEKATTAMLLSPFGVGNVKFRIGSKEPTWVDTVFGGCYHRSVFERIGYFNEDLARGQDREFNFRLRKSGGKILLVPEIKCQYVNRKSFFKFLSFSFSSGFIVFYMVKYIGRIAVSIRNLIPLMFVITLISMFSLSFVNSVFLYVLLSILGLYLFTSFYYSVKATKSVSSFSPIFLLPPLYFLFHVFYGIGSFFGLLKLVYRTFIRKNKERT